MAQNLTQKAKLALDAMKASITDPNVKWNSKNIPDMQKYMKAKASAEEYLQLPHDTVLDSFLKPAVDGFRALRPLEGGVNSVSGYYNAHIVGTPTQEYMDHMKKVLIDTSSGELEIAIGGCSTYPEVLHCLESMIIKCTFIFSIYS